MKRIGILTGGGDVPGLNVVIKTVVNRADRHGVQVLGIRNGWHGILAVDPSNEDSRRRYTLPLDSYAVRSIDRFGGTILHSSRTNPGAVREDDIPGSVDASEGKLDEKGALTRQDVKDAMRELDEVDGVPDGRLDINVLKGMQS